MISALSLLLPSSGNKILNMKKIILLLTLVIISICTFAQSDDSSAKSFENGRELYKMERYGLAMQAFKPLTSAFNDNPYIKQANFYYGVSAFKDNQVEIAASSFKFLKDNYPNWDQIDEVNLWTIKCALAKNKFEDAITTFNALKKDDSKEFATNLILAEIIKIDSINKVEELYNKYPDNKAVAIHMANTIAKQPLLEQDKDLLFSIVNKYNLDTEKYRLIDVSQSEKKSTYSIAILLPFMLEDLEQNRSNIRNQFIIDLYEGFMMGVEEMKSMGIRLNTFAYDTEKSVGKVRQILDKPELQHMDLIYGPLYPGPVKLTNQFSFDYKINMFNPLSGNSLVIGNNPYSFLYMPTYETQGKFAAKLVASKAGKRSGFVIYGEDERDSVMAFNFRKAMFEKGDSAISLFKIQEVNSKRIIQLLTEGTEVEVDMDENDNVSTLNLFKIPKDSLGFVFVASERPSLAASTITALETREDSTFFIGMEKWLSSQIVSYEALERLNCYLLAPAYLDKEKSQYKYFETAYKEKFNTLPSINACLGYETSMVIGRLLQKYGNHFQNKFNDESIKSELFQKYVLKHNNDNQNISVIKFQDSELINTNLRLK